MSAEPALEPAPEATLQRLKSLRAALLKMHKAMLDGERARYEAVHGRVQSSSEMFRLVVEDPWFSWLRPISGFIIVIDEVVSPKQSATLAQVDMVMAQARDLLQPSEEGSLLAQHYYEAIQRDPMITLLHGDVAQLLRQDRPAD